MLTARVLVLLAAFSGSASCIDHEALPDDARQQSDGDIVAVPDAGAETIDDAGPPEPLWRGIVRRERSLAWTDGALLDDTSTIGLARVLAPAAAAMGTTPGALLSSWLHRFATTAHSERAGPARLAEQLLDELGADLDSWDVDRAPFRVTGVHNRIDLMRDDPLGTHCGELRVSLASTDPLIRPFHALFLFRQPATEGDRAPDGVLTCATSALRWALLSDLDDEAFFAAARALLGESLVAERFLMIETVELTVSPWEWRQWVPTESAGGPSLENPPLFQQVDTDALNAPGALRADFLAFVEQNADALAARMVLLPDRYRPRSRRVAQGVPPIALDLVGVSPGVLAEHPQLRQQLEIMGCAACHTADAAFVQTREDRTFSPFYTKELVARAGLLTDILAHRRPNIPFGPLQANPVLPP